jgi:hypothetical protein
MEADLIRGIALPIELQLLDSDAGHERLRMEYRLAGSGGGRKDDTRSALAVAYVLDRSANRHRIVRYRDLRAEKVRAPAWMTVENIGIRGYGARPGGRTVAPPGGVGPIPSDITGGIVEVRGRDTRRGLCFRFPG